jgi:predicted aspartyl protease
MTIKNGTEGKQMTLNNWKQIWIIIYISSLILGTSVQGEQSGRESEKVDWLAGPSGQIKAIRYLKIKEPKTEKTEPISNFRLFSAEPTDTPSLYTIDSPPIAGFVPRIAVAVTDKRSDDLDWVGEPHMYVSGSYLTDNPETDFIIGLFDTGASTNIISNAGAIRTGIYSSDLVTSNTVEIEGAIHNVLASVSQPLGVFMDGLAAIDQNTMTLDDSNMVGQSNISVIVGNTPGIDEPDLPTVVGTPVSVYYVTAISNEHQVSVVYDGNNYTSPDIKFYDHFDSRIPDYANSVPLNLIPAGAADVQYFPDLDGIIDFIFQPGSPSIIGSLLQSLFFVNSVDLSHETNTAIDRDRFMLDTGAQITVVGTSVGARLGLNPDDPDFEVEIQDVSGYISMEPGFYIDTLEIAALGEWLRFTNVPVVMLDVGSPEGGFLDGIIGMNLFTEFNLVLRGGGLIGQDPPSLEFERIPERLIADIAPEEGDGVVNILDFMTLAEAWLATPASPNWNPKADLAPRYTPDSIIDFLDFAVLAEQWLDSATHNANTIQFE